MGTPIDVLLTKTLKQLIAKVEEIREQKWESPYNEGSAFFYNDQNAKLGVLAQLILTETRATNTFHQYRPTYDILKWYYED